MRGCREREVFLSSVVEAFNGREEYNWGMCGAAAPFTKGSLKSWLRKGTSCCFFKLKS